MENEEKYLKAGQLMAAFGILRGTVYLLMLGLAKDHSWQRTVIPRTRFMGYEGLNNKIRVIQRRILSLRNDESLLLKVIACMLEPI